MSRVNLAVGLVQSNSDVYLMPSSSGNVGQVLAYAGIHPTIANAKLLSWTSVSGGAGSYLAYDQDQVLTLPQIRQTRKNQLIGSAPSFTYDGSDRVSTITYSDGSVKTFTYTGDNLTRIDHVYTSPARTYRKDFGYTSNRLTSVTETLL